MNKEQQTQKPIKEPQQRPSPSKEQTYVAEIIPAQTSLQNDEIDMGSRSAHKLR
jgi:hypothetical protein